MSDWALTNAAHKLGMYVITSGYKTDDPAHMFSDKYINADYSNKEEMLRIAKEEKIDYMVSNSNDFGLISTAYVCDKLGLPGHDSYETTVDIHTKSTFKEVAKKLNLHSPVSVVFTNRDEAIEYIKKQKEKIIIKPSDNVGSIGVSTPTSIEDIPEKVDLAFNNSKEKKIIVEPFIEGFFCPATAFIINQKVEAFLTEAYFIYPEGENIAPEYPVFFRCNGYMSPAPYVDDFSKDIIDDFNKIAEYYKLKDGKFHCELMVTKDHKAYIFDVHRRMSGFWRPWAHWDMSEEIKWEDWIVKAECGMDLSDFPKGFKNNRYIYSRNIYAPKNGIIKRLVFDEYLTSHIFPKYEGKNYCLNNLFVTDHIHKPIVLGCPNLCEPILQFSFDNKEEAEKICDPNNNEFYKHISFEYVDQY